MQLTRRGEAMRSVFLAAATVGIAALTAMGPADAQTRQQRQDARSDWNQQQQNVQGRRDGDVIVFGRNMGTDPDPRIRYQIKRDTGAATGGDD
jgi:hypothetical protein